MNKKTIFKVFLSLVVLTSYLLAMSPNNVAAATITDGVKYEFENGK